MAKIPFGKKMQQIRTLGALWKYRTELYRMFRDMWQGKYKFSFLTIVALVAGIALAGLAHEYHDGPDPRGGLGR